MVETKPGMMRAGRAGDVRPDPDPTERTIDSLRREIGALRELIEARLDGGDKAVRLLQEATDRVPLHIREAVDRLKELHEGKFASIQTQFQERDVRVEQSYIATKTAVDAALQAAEKAVGANNVSSSQAIAKSEAATTKQIDAIGTLIAAQAKSTDEKIDDIKSRLQTNEGRGVGRNDFIGWIVAAVAIVGGIVAILATRT